MLEKLTVKQKSLLKIAVWTVSIVWLVFFLAFSLVMATKAKAVFSSTLLAHVVPFWVVFTSLLIVYFIARFIRRRLP